MEKHATRQSIAIVISLPVRLLRFVLISKQVKTGKTRICVLMMGINFHWQRRPLCRRFSGAHSTSIIIVSLHVFPTGDQYITINLLYSLDW